MYEIFLRWRLLGISHKNPQLPYSFRASVCVRVRSCTRCKLSFRLAHTIHSVNSARFNAISCLYHHSNEHLLFFTQNYCFPFQNCDIVNDFQSQYDMHPNVNNNIIIKISDNKITHTKKSDSQFSTDNIVVVVMYCIHSPNTLTSEKSMFASPSTHIHMRYTFIFTCTENCCFSSRSHTSYWRVGYSST